MSKDLVVKVGEYTNKEGEKKNRYVNVGVILDGDNGEFALIDPTVNFAGVLMLQRLTNPQKAGEKVLVSIFDRNEQRAPKPKEDFSDSIPF